MLPARHPGRRRLRCGWVHASFVEAEGKPYVCQYEQVTTREVLKVKPPHCLNWIAPANRLTDLATLLGEGSPNADHIRRLPREGSGPCQGRRYWERVAALLALGSGVPPKTILFATFRAPVRPLSLLAVYAEDPEITDDWDS